MAADDKHFNVQSGNNTVVLNADGKISAQRGSDNSDDQLKAFNSTLPLRQQYANAVRDQPDQARADMRPLRTAMPSASSGSLPTPHAIPHQTPPAQLAQSYATLSNIQDAERQQSSPAGDSDGLNAVSSPLVGSGSPGRTTQRVSHRPGGQRPSRTGT